MHKIKTRLRISTVRFKFDDLSIENIEKYLTKLIIKTIFVLFAKYIYNIQINNFI